MIGAVILAAGGSRRLGRPKQLELYAGTPLLTRAVDAAEGAGCRPIVVVLGAYAERIRPLVAARDVQVVFNPLWEMGMGGSIASGIAALIPLQEVEAAVIMTCDQPGITAAVVADLRGAYDGRPRRSVASEYAGTVGVPALFERSWFGELSRLEGDRGARSVLLAEPDSLLRVPCPAGALDLDS